MSKLLSRSIEQSFRNGGYAALIEQYDDRLRMAFYRCTAMTCDYTAYPSLGYDAKAYTESVDSAEPDFDGTMFADRSPVFGIGNPKDFIDLVQRMNGAAPSTFPKIDVS